MIDVTRDGCVTFPLIMELSVTASCSAANYVPLVIRYPRLDLLALPDESGKVELHLLRLIVPATRTTAALRNFKSRSLERFHPSLV